MKTEYQHIWSTLPIHPGETLAEELEARGIALDDFAEITGYPVRSLETIIRGERPITADLAAVLEETLSVPAQFWINLQHRYVFVAMRNTQA